MKKVKFERPGKSFFHYDNSRSYSNGPRRYGGVDLHERCIDKHLIEKQKGGVFEVMLHHRRCTEYNVIPTSETLLLVPLFSLHAS